MQRERESERITFKYFQLFEGAGVERERDVQVFQLFFW